MADKDKGKPKKKGGGGRTTALAGLLAVVAVVAAWLSNCIPGFGIGSSGDADGEAENSKEAVEAPQKEEPKPEEPKPEEPKPEQDEDEDAAAAGTTLTVTIDVHGCAVGDGAPGECASMCERAELFEGVDDAILDVKEASHESVVAMTDCLKSKGIDKVAIRRE